MLKPLRDFPLCRGCEVSIEDGKTVMRLEFLLPGYTMPIYRSIVYAPTGGMQEALYQFRLQWRRELYDLLTLTQYADWLSRMQFPEEWLNERKRA